MPKIKQLCNVSKVSFTPNGPVSEEALDRVRTLLDAIRPADVGLEQEAQLARNWNNANRVQNGRRLRGGSSQDAPPIKYLHIHENESFSVGIFVMPPTSVIPLHNHPGMTVLSKLLYGTLHVESYDWIDLAVPTNPTEARPAMLVRDGEMSAPCGATVLYPTTGGNIHTFRAITPCALFDILSPPYSPQDGRDCSYFRKSLVREPPLQTVNLPEGVTLDQIVLLEELEDHQPPDGFVVKRGLYKGPIVRS